MKGSSSTFAITDTSNATTLAPAPYAAEREAKAAWQETSDELRGSGGQKYPEGAGEQESTSENKDSSEQETTSDNRNPSTKPTPATSKKTQDPDTGDINAANPTRSQTSTTTNNNNDDQDPLAAPSAFAPQPATSKPKGTNITEGGFDNDDDNPDHNASFTAEIGTENDPGRLAETTFRQRGADIPGPGKGSRQTDVTADGQYDVLQSEQEL